MIDKLDNSQKPWPLRIVTLIAIAPSVVGMLLMRSFGDSGTHIDSVFLIINSIFSLIAGIGVVKGRMTVIGGSIPVALLVGVFCFIANSLIIAVIEVAFFLQIRC